MVEPQVRAEDATVTASASTPTFAAAASPSTTTPPPCKRGRHSNVMLEFFEAESVKEQRRHEESEGKTDRFLSLFEKLVDKITTNN